MAGGTFAVAAELELLSERPKPFTDRFGIEA
jgi:hypothetical protein